jgi:hypothetical protein
MNPEYFILPRNLIAAARELAASRGICIEQIVCEQIERIEHDAGFRALAVASGGRVLNALNERIDTEWPLDLLESISAAAVVAQVLEDLAQEALLTMSEERLAAWELLSRQTGRSYDQLFISEILQRPENQPKC